LFAGHFSGEVAYQSMLPEMIFVKVHQNKVLYSVFLKNFIKIQHTLEKNSQQLSKI